MQPKVVALLCRRFGWDASQLQFSPLGGGITNQNYRVSVGQKDLVVRVNGEDTHLLGIDRSCERACSTIAASLGIGAPVLFAEDEVLVTQFLSGHTLTEETAKAPNTLKKIVAALQKYHNGPAFPKTFSPFETVRSYARLATERGVLLPDDATRAVAALSQMEKALWPPPKMQPCHNDLLAGNLLDQGDRICIVDWEYAGMGDIFFDLGNFAANQSLDEEHCRLLLVEYFGSPTQEAQARLTQMKRVSDLREAFWGFLQSGISKIEFDYLGYAQKHLARFWSAS